MNHLSLVNHLPNKVEPVSYVIEYNTKVAELKDGAEFGELALINSKPRAASIRTITKTYLATLDKEVFNTILKKSQLQHKKDKIELLENFAPFK